MNSIRRSSATGYKQPPLPGASPPGASIVRGIVKVAVHNEGQQPLLYEFNQQQPLLFIVRDVCSKWALTNPDKYCFQHSDTKEYITEKTRHQLKNGALLRVAELPKRTVKEICIQLASKDEKDVVMTISTLRQSLSEEKVTDFSSQSGLKILVSQILKFADSVEETLSTAFSFIQHVFETSERWVVLSEPFVKLLLKYATTSQHCSEASFAFLESALEHAGPPVVELVTSNITINQLSGVLASSTSTVETKIASLGFTNTMLLKCNLEKRFELLSDVHKKHFPELINKQILAKAPMTEELTAHLSTFQTVYLSLIGKLLLTPYHRDKKTHQSLLLSFMMACQASMGRIRPVGISSLTSPTAVSEDFPDVDTSRMGLTKVEPAEEFQEVPGGLLALECLSHFSLNWSEECDQHFVSNLSRTAPQQCPFVRGGFAIVRVVADLLNVTDHAPGSSSQYYKIFFNTRSYFEDIFSLAMQLFNKTWREMAALTVDVDKVATVVRRQVSLVIKNNNSDWSLLKAGLWEMNYTKISSVIEEEKNRVDDATSHSAPAKELAIRLRPDIVELVKEQRLNTLVAGGFFPNWKEKEKGRSKSTWCCRLHTNHMVLHWAECETSTTTVPFEQLPNKIPLSEVRELVVGKECPHVKSSSKKPGTWSNYAFALMYNNDDIIGFLVEDERTFASWVDGLRVLLKQPMCEASSMADIDMLMEMELKIRLLGVENTDLPDQAPKIPAPPADFDFYYKTEAEFPP